MRQLVVEAETKDVWGEQLGGRVRHPGKMREEEAEVMGKQKLKLKAGLRTKKVVSTERYEMASSPPDSRSCPGSTLPGLPIIFILNTPLPHCAYALLLHHTPM